MNRRWITSTAARGVRRTATFSLLLAALMATACAPLQGLSITQPSATLAVPSTGGSTANVLPSVKVSDQAFDGTSVVVDDVVSKGPGWMVIHSQAGGAVGPVVGMTHVNDGDNKNVVVKVDPNQTTPVMYAMLHTDTGKVGTYEYPGPDIPVSVDGQMITPAFKAQKQSATSNIAPAVIANSQVIKDGKVTIAEVDSPGPAWVAIHIVNPDGTPGDDIGFSAIKAGKNINVSVTVDQARVTQTMFAMLHVDDGEVGAYEYPTHDEPVKVGGQILMTAFASDGTAPMPVSASMGMHDAGTSPTAGAGQTPAAGMGDMGNAAPTQTTNMVVQTPAPGITPKVVVSDQSVTSGMVKVDDVVSSGPGWVVIYTTNASGQPDQAIGHASVQQGDNKNVMVPVDPALAKGKLTAQLHVDAGQTGTFEFPGPDQPLMIGVQMISGVFNVTTAAANKPAPAATPVSTATAMASMPMVTNTPGAVSSAAQPFIKTADQPIVNSTIVIPEVFTLGDSWLVIHRQYGDGTMGPMVGYVRVKDGDNTNVVVHLDTNFTSSTMYAMLHDDKGKIGKLEYPGPDEPTMVNGEMVNMPFLITGNKSADAVINISKDTNTVKHLVDGYDMSLYLSLNDKTNQSNCTGDCLSVWKPVLATGRVVAGTGVASNKLGVILMPDGSRQVTYAGAPLYTYTGDTKPGDATGQGLDGSWFLVNP